MTETRRIMISLPQELLSAVDDVVADESKSRSEFIREAMKLYLQERNKQQLRTRMQNGYLEMAGINLALAREALQAENQALETTEIMVSKEGVD